MQNFNINPNVFMCFFDVSSLFTNVPLDETIKICPKALDDKSESQLVTPIDVFVELMKCATFSVEFSFNNTMYKQTDGVALSSPLGLLLDIMKKSYYLRRRSLRYTSNMLTTRLPFSITKLKQMNF